MKPVLINGFNSRKHLQNTPFIVQKNTKLTVIFEAY
jgi:hypothetical protein